MERLYFPNLRRKVAKVNNEKESFIFKLNDVKTRYLVDPASFGTLNLELKPCKLLSVVPQGKAFSVYGSVYR